MKKTVTPGQNAAGIRLAIVGTRGIPAAYGGFETFAEEVSRRLADEGYNIMVYCERASNMTAAYNGVKIAYSYFSKSRNPLLFYFDSILKAVMRNNTILVAGAGGALFYFLPKLFNVFIITNIDGLESKRGKWSLLKRLYIKMSEYLAANCSDIIIADSQGIRTYLLDTYKIDPRRIALIEYGAYTNNLYDQAILDKYSLMHNEYYLVVSRLEPENNIRMIVEGYLNAETVLPLVIVGTILDTDYVRKILKYRSDKVVLLGGIYDRSELQALRYSCSAYIHGHSVGGTNPSLLEALGSGNICICHDNIFNREVTASRMFYFSNREDLREAIETVGQLRTDSRKKVKQFGIDRVQQYYNWDRIASRYDDLLQSIPQKGTRSR